MEKVMIRFNGIDDGKYEVFVGEWLGTVAELYAQAGEY